MISQYFNTTITPEADRFILIGVLPSEVTDELNEKNE
jgi:hypothetical protein